MKYELVIDIVIKSYPKTGKVKQTTQKIIIDEMRLGDMINNYLLARTENKWESIKFQVNAHD